MSYVLLKKIKFRQNIIGIIIKNIAQNSLLKGYNQLCSNSFYLYN